MDATATQPELGLRLRRRTPEQREEDARELELLLRDRGWMTRREIEGERPDWRDGEGRYVRHLAEISGKIVSGPGTPGYRLADDSTMLDEDVDAALNRAANAIVAQMRSEARRVRHFRTLLGLRRAYRARLDGRPS